MAWQNGTGRIFDLQPAHESVFASGATVSLEAKADGIMFPTPAPTLYTFKLYLRSENVYTAAQGVFTSTSGTGISAVTVNKDWGKPAPIIAQANATPADGWWASHGFATAQAQGGAEETIAELRHLFKVGTPPNNICWGQVAQLAPCDVVLQPSVQFVATATFAYGVKDDPALERYSFDSSVTVRDPLGGIQAKAAKTADVVLGGNTTGAAAMITYNNPQAIPGVWTVTGKLEATNIDIPNPPTVVVSQYSCNFLIGGPVPPPPNEETEVPL